MELFRLFGSVLVDSDQADASLARVDGNAEKVGGTLSKTIGTAAKWGIGIATAAATAAVAVVGLAVNVGEDLNKALNGLQAETGATDESMAELKDSMLAIYNNNFGESFEDIGTAMATVSKATGLTGEELETATTNALIMRDTFDMDVTGSISAVDQMMKQFGLTSDEAYNLIAQGAQNGMDAQGDLVDIVKEYSVQFETMGFDAEEMFNMLSNGAEEGGFSFDVMGDAVKEFNIRSKDGSTATAEAFKALGLNAADLSTAFSKGGEDGKLAFTKVSDALKNTKDPLEQNQIGTALWGTKWEDLGAKSILALGTVDGAIDGTIDTLGKINAVKYDTFGEAMAGIKRNLETGILIPIGDAVLPALEKFSAYIVENMPIIKKYITDMTEMAIEKFDKIVIVVKDIAENIFPNMQTKSFDLKEEVKSLVTTGFDIMITALTWIKDNIPLIKTTIIGLTGVWLIQKGVVLAHNIALMAHNVQTLTAKGRDIALTTAIIALYIAQGIQNGITWLGVTAQTAFNLVMSLNPIALVIIALAALGVAIYAVVKHWKDIVTWIEKAWDWLTKWNGEPVEDKNATVTTTQKTVYSSSGRQSGSAQFAVGTRYLPADMVIQAHEGEMIVPKSENPYANSSGKIIESPSNNQEITINTPVYLDGKKITTVTSRVQLQSNKSKARALGVVTA